MLDWNPSCVCVCVSAQHDACITAAAQGLCWQATMRSPSVQHTAAPVQRLTAETHLYFCSSSAAFCEAPYDTSCR